MERCIRVLFGALGKAALMRVPIYDVRSARRPAATARQFSTKRRHSEFIRFCVTLSRPYAPARPRCAWPVLRNQQQTARRVAFGEEQQTAAGFEVERFALSAERADHDRACCRERLFGSPERVFSLSRARDDQTIKRQAVLCEADRVRRALFGECSIFAGPEDARGPYPVRS